MKTIAIAAYNEEKSIQKSINSIIPQLDKEDEVLIVASGCTDNTVPILKNLQEKDKRIKLLIQKKKQGKASAINLILKKAKNNVIIFADADVILGKNAIRNLLRNFDENTGAVSGKICSYKTDTFFDKMQDFANKQLNEKKSKEFDNNNFSSLNGYLFAVRKGIISKIDTKNLVEDALIGWLIRKKGYKVIYEPKAVVYVQAAQNLSDYLKQKTRIRLGWWQMNKIGMPITGFRSLRQLKNLFKSFYAWPYLALEFYCWLKTYIDFKRNRLYWEHINSSKI
jgi:cellulose synthase/poly-beta-1,6-N-acetylglucosamine synthase-like glycosyltransferase